MKPCLAALLFLTLSFQGTGCAVPEHPGPVSDASITIISEEVISEAWSLLAAGNIQGVIDRLEIVEGKTGDSDLFAHRSWLLGKAYFLVAEGRISSLPDERPPGFGILDSYQVSLLTRARDNLLAAVEVAPEASFSAEAHYLAGRTMDHGYLQDFPGAIKAYRQTTLFYPHTEFGKNAAARLKALEEKY